MMQLKLKSFKCMKLWISILILPLLVSNEFIFSQTTEKRIKIDGVSSVIGDYVILDSDIDKMMIEIESQGVSTKNITRCELLGKLMEDKLYAHHAIQDSIEVSDQEVYDYVDQSISYFIEQLGSIEKVLELEGPHNLPNTEESIVILTNEMERIYRLKDELTDKNIEIQKRIVQIQKSLPPDDMLFTGGERSGKRKRLFRVFTLTHQNYNSIYDYWAL